MQQQDIHVLLRNIDDIHKTMTRQEAIYNRIISNQHSLFKRMEQLDKKIEEILDVDDQKKTKKRKYKADRRYSCYTLYIKVVGCVRGYLCKEKKNWTDQKSISMLFGTDFQEHDWHGSRTMYWRTLKGFDGLTEHNAMTPRDINAPVSMEMYEKFTENINDDMENEQSIIKDLRDLYLKSMGFLKEVVDNDDAINVPELPIMPPYKILKLK